MNWFNFLLRGRWCDWNIPYPSHPFGGAYWARRSGR